MNYRSVVPSAGVGPASTAIHTVVSLVSLAGDSILKISADSPPI